MTTINAETLQKMFIAGAKNLEAKKEWINELNVFPVPDGDTGTNMTLTIMSAAKEVGAITEPTMETIAKAISTGSDAYFATTSGLINTWPKSVFNLPFIYVPPKIELLIIILSFLEKGKSYIYILKKVIIHKW